MSRIVGFLRGVNVGGNHKVQMIQLRQLLKTEIGCSNVQTVLNSGNLIFDHPSTDLKDLEIKIEHCLLRTFEFSIPTILVIKTDLDLLQHIHPFELETDNKDLRFYVSFLKKEPTLDIQLPCSTNDNSFTILKVVDKCVFSVLDLNRSKSVNGMQELERIFGKELTTRNWRTINRVINTWH